VVASVCTPKHPNQQGCWNDDVTGAKTGINQNITFFPHLGEASSCLAFWLLLQARTSRSGVVDTSCGHDGAVIGANAEMFKHDGQRMAIRHLCVVFVQVLKFNFKRIKSIQKLCRDLLYDQLSRPKD